MTDKKSFEVLRERCAVRTAERQRVGALIYEAIASTENEAAIAALVALAWQVLEPKDKTNG